MKQFVFSEEIIQTGIAEIDNQIFDSYKRTQITVANNSVFPAGTGTFVPGETIYQGASYETANAVAVVHSYDPHSSIHVIRMIGEFVTGNVTGVTSGALRSVSVVNTDRTQPIW
jgi:hypothetical protein